MILQFLSSFSLRRLIHKCVLGFLVSGVAGDKAERKAESRATNILEVRLDITLKPSSPGSYGSLRSARAYGSKIKKLLRTLKG
jgi:hypothetical protein